MTASPQASPTPVPGRPEPGEAFFRQSIADLSKRLGERAARDSSAEPQAAAEARRRAMQAYERERARKLRLVLTGVGAVFATAGFAWAVVLLGEPESLPPPPSQIADVQSEPPAAPPVASAAPAAAARQAAPAAPQPVEPPPAPHAVTESQPTSLPTQADPPSAPPAQTAAVPPSELPKAQPPQAPPAQTAAVPPSEPPKAQPPQVPPAPATAPRPSPLGRDEIREVQKRLRSFGFDPGPADGVAGRQTEVATQRYLEARGQPQLPPTDRDLLDQLRQDSTPPVVQTPPQTQVAQRPAQYPGQSSGQYSGQAQRSSFDPFQPVKTAGAEITRFLQSVFR